MKRKAVILMKGQGRAYQADVIRDVQNVYPKDGVMVIEHNGGTEYVSIENMSQIKIKREF